MEWKDLDSEDLLLDDQFPTDLALPDRFLEHIADEDIPVDICELDAYLYPREPAPQAAPAFAAPSHSQPSCSADYFGKQVDPLVEFFPDLADAIMPPHTSLMPQHPSEEMRQAFHYSPHEFDFMETPQQLDRYCKRENSGSVSPISVGSPSPSASNGTAGPIRTALVCVRPSPYVELDDYRNKRDKNNVASARSRQKRQEKFNVMKKECADLELRNVELRATLSTLEKSVQEYKNIMLAFMNKT